MFLYKLKGMATGDFLNKASCFIPVVIRPGEEHLPQEF